MKAIGIVAIIALILAAIAALNSFFIVDQREQALKLRVGAVQQQYNPPGTDEAGLKFKVPFFETVVKYDKRNLGLDIPDIELLDANQEQLVVDAFVRYKIANPLAFYQRLTTVRNAEGQLNRFTETAIRNALAERNRQEIISGARLQLMEQIKQNLSETVDELGIEIIDVRIRRADLPLDVSSNLFNQMKATRNQQAELIRANGDREAAEIRAKADRDKTVILADANRESEQTRGIGDAKRNEIYADAYNRDPEFFRFQRALIACEKAIQSGTQLVIGPDALGICDQFIESARANGGSR